jgi:hypothetical protein
MTTKMRYCCCCGAKLGAFADRDYDDLDTCGSPKCVREARDRLEIEAIERRERRERAEEDDYERYR